jgi:hypothetical protein
MDRNTAQTVVRVFAVLAWLMALLLLAASILFGFFFGHFMQGMMEDPTIAAELTAMPAEQLAMMQKAIPIIAAVILFPLAILYAAVGVGLWKQQKWARITAIVLSALELLSFPFGTVIGAIGIWLFGFDNSVRALFTAEDKKTVKKKRTK